MLSLVNYALVYAGIAVMVYNIFGFIRYARNIQGQSTWRASSTILYIPIVLVVLFLLGYLAVALFGQPDIVIAGILFGGSLFVLFMHKYLQSITQRIMENERLETELKAAERSNEIKASFLDSMSHEMRTPLNVILGMDALALKNPDLPVETRGQLEKIDASAKHLLGLVNNLLDVNHNETGAFSVKNEEFSLQNMLGQVNDIANALCEEKGLVYESRMPQLEASRFMGDAMSLKRVLLSMLDNAVKFTDVPGTVTLATKCLPGDEGRQVIRFAVSDSGVGIDDDFIPRIFEPFTREDSGSTSRYGGSGLSLTVTKNLVELMGGSIEVESKKGVGTTFTVVVPLEYADAQDEQTTEEPDFNPVEALKGSRVLIVEDIPDNAEIVADLLELEDVETEHAENGQIALDMFSQSPEWHYDAILMDLRMPVMDGLDAARNIRAMEREDAKAIPIVALTANAFEEDKRRSLEVGMNAHLAKPADADMLYSTLGNLIHDTARGDV